jgi:hypothetical protein
MCPTTTHLALVTMEGVSTKHYNNFKLTPITGYAANEEFNQNYNNAPYTPTTHVPQSTQHNSQWVPKQSKAVPITDPNNLDKSSEMTKAYVSFHRNSRKYSSCNRISSAPTE